jgi:hypothetical protein
MFAHPAWAGGEEHQATQVWPRMTAAGARGPSLRGPLLWLSAAVLHNTGLASGVGVGFTLGVSLDKVAEGRPKEPERPLAPTPPAYVQIPRIDPRLARGTVMAALRSAGIVTQDEELDAVARRARWSALLPELRVGATQVADERASNTETGTRAPTLYDSVTARSQLEARATFRLDRLLYGGDEPQLERLKQEQREHRLRVVFKVLELLVQWQRAKVHVAQAPVEGTERQEAELHLLESELALDVLTDGWFGAMAQRGR